MEEDGGKFNIGGMHMPIQSLLNLDCNIYETPGGGDGGGGGRGLVIL